MFDLIEVSGTPFQRGREVGARAAGAIHENVAVYLELMRLAGEAHRGLTAGEALAAARSFEPALATHAPALLEEMRGIADGAGCPLDQVLLINARSELMGTLGSNQGECTSLAATPGATRHGGTLLGQNWDWHTAVRPDPVLLHLHLPGGLQVLTLAEAGQVGKIGLNSAGLGVCLNFLAHADPPGAAGGPKSEYPGRGIPGTAPSGGMPVHVLLRLMLESAGLDRAVHHAYSLPRAGSANVLLAHKAGDIIDLELTPQRADFLYADDGWLAHTNHFESPRLRDGDVGVAISPSTLVRAARARRLMAASAGSHSVDTFKAILSDHAYGPLAICRHGDPAASRLEHTTTRASLIMDLEACTLHVAAGQPCQVAYHAHTLSTP
ncbi:MAG: hypothetical protein JXA93_04350 [Anaerolineae bacterium]|nr:hypothetical protein [Anaerolineae bacterium]